jgi:hypothetical protein
MSVEFKANHADLLEVAAKSLDYEFRMQGTTAILSQVGTTLRIDLAAGRATIREDQQGCLNELKRAYSMEAVRRVAQRNRWTIVDKVVKTTGTKMNLNKSH